jgi:hypothetical protein
MSGLVDVGRFLILAGTIVIVIGVVLLLSDKLPLGALPGDLHFGQGRLRVHIPIVTCLLLCILLTIVFNFFPRR